MWFHFFPLSARAIANLYCCYYYYDFTLCCCFSVFGLYLRRIGRRWALSIMAWILFLRACLQCKFKLLLQFSNSTLQRRIFSRVEVKAHIVFILCVRAQDFWSQCAIVNDGVWVGKIFSFLHCKWNNIFKVKKIIHSLSVAVSKLHIFHTFCVFLLLFGLYFFVNEWVYRQSTEMCF
jgi:hypothetical protein